MDINKKTHKLKNIIFVLLLIILFIQLIPTGITLLNWNRNKELSEKIKSEALSANIYIVKVEKSEGYNTTSTSYSVGSSGVIIGRKEDRCYALTAEHVISDWKNENINYLVMDHNDMSMSDYLNSGEEFISNEGYYSKFPSLVVEYADESFDLALISFVSDKDYICLDLADQEPKFGDVVATLSNKEGERNIVSSGIITRPNPKLTGISDNNISNLVIRHNAHLAPGSSGSALVNEDLEIVGINLGGYENIFRRFISGMTMPAESVKEFLIDSNISY